MVSKRICLRLSGFAVTVLGLALVLSTGATAQASAAVAAAKPSQPSSAVGGLSVSLSTTTADAAQVTYTLGFAVSATGALAANQGTFTLNLPSGSAYAGGSGNPIVFDDLTSGQTGSLGYLDSGTTLQVPVPIAVAAGDMLEVSLTGITNAGTAGPQSLTVSTSSDTTPATAAYTLTSGNVPVASLGNVTLSTPAAGATGVTYTFEFTASKTGSLVAGHADFTLVLPAGSSYPGGASGGLVFDDLTSGQSGSYTYLESSSTLTNFVPVNVAPGDKVKVTLYGIASTDTAGPQTLSFSTSSDTQPVSTGFSLTAGNQQVALSQLTLSTPAAGAGGVTYSFEFTASKTGALVARQAGFTLVLPPGSSYPGGPSGGLVFDDLTSGQSGSYTYIENSPTLANYVPVDVAAGDKVKVTLYGLLSGGTPGPRTLSFSTSSDTKPATAAFTLTQPTAVAAPGLRVSTQAPGGNATYTATLTTSATGALTAGQGGVTLAAPAGTVFGAAGPYTIDDITAQQTGAMSPSISNGGATVTLTTPIAVAAGDQVSITAAGVTNPVTTGNLTADLSTTSDTVPVTSPSFFIGDSVPVFTAASPPLSVAPGASMRYTFATGGYPPASYELIGAPSWLSINSVTGKLGGTVPAATKSFTYSVQAANSVGTATEGPYTVTVGATATISGTVVNDSGDPVADVEVDACDPTGGACESATTDDHGAFSLAALIGATVVLTAYPPPGSGVTTSSTSPIKVPARGLTGETITVRDGIPPLPGTLLINGSPTPVVYWASPSTATYTGCPDGDVTVSVEGQNTQTGHYATDVVQLTEAPAGSGFYTGTIPPQEPVHGPVSITDQVFCPHPSAVLPASGVGGTRVIINGTGFTGATAVKFGAASAGSFQVLSDSVIAAVAPTGTGAVTISVVTPSGTARLDGSGGFTYATAASPVRPAVQAAGRPAAPRPQAEPPSSMADEVFEQLNDQIKEEAKNLADQVNPDSLYNAADCSDEQFKSGLEKAHDLIKDAEDKAIARIMALAAPIVAEIVIATLLASGGLAATIIGLEIAALEWEIKTWVEIKLNQLVDAYLDPKLKNAWEDRCGAPPGNDETDGYIDPSGTVLDTNGHPIADATVTILRSYTKNGAYLPPSTSSPGIEPAVNPQITKADGVFHWDVAAGYYKIEASEAGCTVPGSASTTAVIGPYAVPPPRVGLTITLACGGEKPPAAPAVTSLSQATGPPAGGTVLTVLGTNFTPGAAVTFGTIPAKAVTYLSPQALSVTAPKASGLLDVRVQTAGGTSAKTAADRFFSGIAPSVTKVSPAKGPAVGGTTVTITGNGFTSVTQVSFGGLAAAKFSVKSATRIVAVTPKAGAGPAGVLVANPAGANANSAAFDYLAAQTAYVATGTGVVPVSVATGKAGPVIKVAGAAHVATTPDGQTVFVSGSKGVTPVSTAANLPGGAIKAGKDPGAIAVTPDGAIAYVVNYGSNSVTPIGTSTGLPGKAVAVGKQPDAIAITPNGKTAYVANYGSGTLTPISTSTGKAGKPIKVGVHPDAIVITPNGKTAYVANDGSNTVTPVTIATGKAGQPIRVGVHPDALVVTPDGRTVYVVNGGSNALTPIATATGKAGKAIATGKTPTSAAITPDGKTVYVVNQGSGTLSLITSATGKIAKTIGIGKNPEAITITA